MKYLSILPFLLSAVITSSAVALEIPSARNLRTQTKKEKTIQQQTDKSDSTDKKTIKTPTKDTINSSANDYYKKGREAYLRFTSKGYKEAIELFDSALKIDKKYAKAMASKAEAQAMLSRVIYQPKNGVIRATMENDAYQNAFIAADLEPNLSDAHRALSMVYFVQQRYTEGKTEADKAIKLDENDAEAYLLLWLNSPDKEILKADNYKSSNYYKALDLESETIENALKIDPDLILAYIQLGVASANQNKYFDSIKYYEKAIELNPQSEEAYTYLGFLYNNSLQYNDAIASFTEALKIEPQRSDAIYGMGVAYLRKRDRDTALEYFYAACDADYRDSCDQARKLDTGSFGIRRGRRNGLPGLNNSNRQ